MYLFHNFVPCDAYVPYLFSLICERRQLLKLSLISAMSINQWYLPSHPRSCVHHHCCLASAISHTPGPPFPPQPCAVLFLTPAPKNKNNMWIYVWMRTCTGDTALNILPWLGHSHPSQTRGHRERPKREIPFMTSGFRICTLTLMRSKSYRCAQARRVQVMQALCSEANL